MNFYLMNIAHSQKNIMQRRKALEHERGYYIVVIIVITIAIQVW